MARFNAAKMWGAIDGKFQLFYNQLIDLLDTGYMVESTVADKRIRIEITPKDGIKITADGTSILSIDPITGQIVIGSYDATIDALDGVVSALGGTVTTLSGTVTTLDGTVTTLDGGVVKKDVSYQGVAIGSSTGFTSTATIDGVVFAVTMNATKGIEITADATPIFSVDGTTGEIVMGKYDTEISTLDGAVIKKDVSYAGTSIGASTGLVSTATIDGVVFAITVNATKGIEITADTVKVFGIDTTGKLFSSALTSGNDMVEGKISSVDGDTWFDLDAPEIVQQATINSKAVRVEMSPANPFKLSMMGVTHMQNHVYVTDSTGYSGANILVTSKYDVNEDGVIDWKDLKLVFDYVMHHDISPGVAWPAGYPAFARMDINDNGLVNSADVQEIYEHMPSSDRVIVGGHALGIDTTGAWISEDWGDSPSYLWHAGNDGSGSGLDADTLDGLHGSQTTWTPDLQFGGAKVGITYSQQTGVYSKIGDMVFFTGFINMTSKGTSTGNAIIEGLPFTVGHFSCASVRMEDMVNTVTGHQQAILIETTAGSRLEMFSAGLMTVLTHAHFNNTSIIIISGQYQV